MGAMKDGEHHKVLVGNLKKFYPDIYERLLNEANHFSYREFDRLLDRGISQGFFLPDMDKELALITLTYTMTALFERKHHFLPGQNVPRSECRPPVRDNITMQMAFEYVIVNFFRGLATHKGIEVIDEMVKKYR
jgi:hypothetical protein